MNAQHEISLAAKEATKRVILARIESWMNHSQSFEIVEKPSMRRKGCSSLDGLEPTRELTITLTLKDVSPAYLGVQVRPGGDSREEDDFIAVLKP